mmetsp:Transcript_11489/g.31348  ORF Transcript_11489/g.31348 Transcript_11489/m.31348 type:complete len:95 (+) Transcript_11489:1825-2109(+)
MQPTHSKRPDLPLASSSHPQQPACPPPHARTLFSTAYCTALLRRPQPGSPPCHAPALPLHHFMLPSHHSLLSVPTPELFFGRFKDEHAFCCQPL